MGAAAVRVLSRLVDRPRTARPRRFRPLTEPMEARAVLSSVGFTHAIAAPMAMAQVGLHANPGTTPLPRSVTMDTINVNGQVEVQPGD
jgi:hypothetical protein